EVSKAAGKIICMSSVHERIPWAGHVNYAASKGGIMMMMQSLAQEVAPLKIRVNSIAPGAIRTPINTAAWSTPQAYSALMTLVPYGRIGEPEDIARAAVWLASDAADYQLKRPRADFLPRRGDTDDDADAPAAMAAFQCLPHRLHIADAFEAVIGAALCHIDEKGHEIAFHILRIDEMRHAELLGEGAPARVHIDADNHIGTDHAAALYDVEPDAPQPEHDDVGARLDFGGVDDGADPGRDAAADVADLVERRVLADLRDRDLG